MPRHFLKFFVLLLSFALMGSFAGRASAHDAPLIDRSLVQATMDPKVYFIQGGQKHWIVSEQAFLAQGFRWSDISIVEAHRLAETPDGAEISAPSFLGLTVDRSLLPDLAPVAPYDLRYAIENGRTRLRFTATFWNRGKGALELRTNAAVTAGDGSYSATQRMFRADGTFIDRAVGVLFWHEIHQHYHYDDFGQYILELVRPASGALSVVQTVTEKTTFCMRDDQTIGAPADGTKQSRKYMGCHGNTQGVSVGWADVYPSTLADQFVDVTDFPAGIYKLSFTVDPHATFAESRRDNNVSATLVELDPAKRTLKILAAASAYPSPNNKFQDGMLIRGEGDSRVYVMRANKKRMLRTESAFLSYGYSWGNVYTLPSGAIAEIPNDKLVRVSGASAVYVLNEAGYKRRVLNPKVMSSYEWTGADVATINQTEFGTYPETEIVMREGDTRVFSIREKRAIGTMEMLSSLGYAPESVHVVNATDFEAMFGTTVAAQNLMIPWDIGFLPDGDMLVTERVGNLRRIGRQNGVMAVPGTLKGGEGGLMGIAIDPNFDGNHFIYLYYTTDEGGKKNRVTRFRLEGTRLVLDKIVLDGIPSAIYHDGGQVEFGPDGKLYVATGDATQPDLAQDTRSLAGKILRINSDGTIPSDNPFGNAVWSYGHRNPQGFAWDQNGRMFATEHGPTGDLGQCCRDEVNRIEKGKNYGWPVITGDQRREGMVSPLLTSGATATWAPSGIAYVAGTLFFTGLKGSALYQTTVDQAGNLTNLRTLLSGTYGRIRAAVLGPDGLYLTTSNRDGRGTVQTGDDKILKVSPDFLLSR